MTRVFSDRRCRGNDTRVGSPRRMESFKTRPEPIGLQLGRARQSHGRLLPSTRPYRMLAVGPGAIGPPYTSSRADLGPGRGPWYKVINAQSRVIRVAGKPSHFGDLSEETCRRLHRFRGQDDKTTDRSSTVHSS